MNQFTKTSAILAIALSLAACKSKSTSSAAAAVATPGGKAMGAFTPGAPSANSLTLQQIHNLRRQAIQTFHRMNRIHQKLQVESLRPTTEDFCQALQFDSGLGDSASCGTPSCDSTQSTDTQLKLVVSQTCTDATSTGSCGGITYTATNVSSALDYNLDASLTDGTGTFAMKVNMTADNMTASDSSVSGAINCHFGFSQAFAQSGNSADSDVSCSDVAFTCTVGTETLTCADLASSKNACN